MLIGTENNLAATLEAVDEKVKAAGVAIRGSQPMIRINGQVVKLDATREEMIAIKSLALDILSRELADMFVEMRDMYGVTYEPPLYTAADVRASMIENYGEIDFL